MSSIIVTVRLSPTEAKALDDMLVFQRWRSRSQIVREALEAFMLSHGLKKDALHQIRRERPRDYTRDRLGLAKRLAQEADSADSPAGGGGSNSER